MARPLPNPRVHAVCPHCGATTDVEARWTDKLPDRGDFCVCPACQGVSVWVWIANVLTVRPLNPVEAEEADEDPGVAANRAFLDAQR